MIISIYRRLVVVCAALLLAACSTATTGTGGGFVGQDAAVSDAATGAADSNASATDASSADTGSADAGNIDTGSADTGSADAGNIDAGDPSAAWPKTCTSGMSWKYGNSGNGKMRPGTDCNGCHKKYGEGPMFLIAGTVFPGFHEKDDCYGVNAAVVEVTDSNNKVYTFKANQSGNFGAASWQLKGFTAPYRAKVIYNGKTREMYAAQSNGSCNVCHTRAGAFGAPGRIATP